MVRSIVQIRHAIPSDVKAILEITNHEIINGTAFWMNTPRTLEEQQEWFKGREKAGFPVFVATDSSQNILGFASYGAFRAYEGYKHTVEHSIYITPSAQGKGIGRQLLERLISYASSHGVKVMVAAITADNHSSVRLHEGFGFKTSGILPQTGIKFDKWLDLLFMYKLLPLEAHQKQSSIPVKHEKK